MVNNRVPVDNRKNIKMSPTPPMGWNSWNCYGAAITQDKIKAQAKALVDNGLNTQGYIYVNIDDGWQGERGGKYDAIQGNKKFPDMKGLCDYIHKLGLKVGIYSTPWRKSYAGYTGGHNHEMEDAKQWAEWSIDFLKYDWRMMAPEEPSEMYVKKMRTALDAVGGEIVFSLANTAPISKGEIWSKYANMWRTGGDITDTWERVSEIGFNQEGWKNFAGPGHWNDPDMMVLGYVGCGEVYEDNYGNEWGKYLHPSRLNNEEQKTHMTLWCMLAAPLLLGCDLTKMDDYLKGIITNDEVLKVDQDSLGIQGGSVRKEDYIEIWVKPLQYGNKAVSIFNKGESTVEAELHWADINIDSSENQQYVRDLWRHENVGTISKNDKYISVSVKPHGAELFIVGRKRF